MKSRIFFSIIAVLALTGCKSTPITPTFTATVTVKPLAGGGFYMEQDDSTALIATNGGKYPFSGYGEKRAMVIYNLDKTSSDKSTAPGYKYVNNVTLMRMDTIMTKNPVPTKGSVAEDEKAFGNDAIGLYLNSSVFPYSMIEDGYLQLSFAFDGMGQIPHVLNVVTGVNPDDPYEVEIRHDAKGEFPQYRFTGLINFPLKSLPDTKGEVKELTVVWKSLVSMQKESVKFKYCSRTNWPE